MKPDTYREHLTDLQLEVEALRAKLKEAQTGDLISRQAVMDALTEYWQGISDRHPTLDGEMAVYADCKGIIKRLPSAQPEIIRCKYCKHYEQDVMGNPWGVCCHPDWITDNCGCSVVENGWCYRAERRTDESISD